MAPGWRDIIIGKIYGRLKPNLIDLIFFRNIVKDSKTLQNTSKDHAKEPRNCQHCFLPKSNLSLGDFFFSFVNLQYQEFEGLSPDCLALFRRGYTGGGKWWPVRKMFLSLCCSWMLWMGVPPLSLNVQLRALLPHQYHSGRGLGNSLCSATQLQGHCTLRHLTGLLHAQLPLLSFWLSWKGRKNNYFLLRCRAARWSWWAWVGPWFSMNQRCVCQFTESMNFQLDAVFQVFTFTLCADLGVFFEKAQSKWFLHVTSLVSPLLWRKSKYGAVPNAKWLLWFLFLPKIGHRESSPGCLQIAELRLPLIFRQEGGEFRVQQTL